MALDLVHFAETQTYELIDSILQEELNEIKENGGGNATEVDIWWSSHFQLKIPSL